MWDTLVGGHIRRANRNLFVLNLLLALSVAGVFLVSTRYFVNVFQGPNRINPRDLLSLKKPDTLFRNYVVVQGDKTLDTGMTEVSRTKNKYSGEVRSERVEAHFLLLRVGNKGLIVKSPSETASTQFTGSLTEIPADLRSKLFTGHSDVVLPFMLDAGNYTTTAYTLLLVGCPILGLAVWNLYRTRQRMADPLLHPLARSLAKYGDVEGVARGMDQEYQTARRQIGDMVLTTSWLLKPTFLGADLMYLGDLIWAYKKVTQHRTNFVPTGKTYAVVIRARNGAVMEFTCTMQQSDEFIQQLDHQLPWAFLGYDPQLETEWNRNRAGIVEAFDQRRAQFFQQRQQG